MSKNVLVFTIYDSDFDDRQQDVRATEIDKVEMHLSFRPGDIVRALVVLLLSFKNFNELISTFPLCS